MTLKTLRRTDLLGLLHGRWLVGIIAGMLFAIALYRRGQFGDVVLAHVTANALIAAYVLFYAKWSLWSQVRNKLNQTGAWRKRREITLQMKFGFNPYAFVALNMMFVKGFQFISITTSLE